jgi:type I restriction enzyme S subunit
MAGEWHYYKVGDLFDLKPGFAFKSADFVELGAPVIKIKNVKAGSVVLDDLSYVDERFLDTKKSYIVRNGDILITMSGNRFDGSRETWVGKVAQFMSAEPYLLNQRVAILRPKAGVQLDRRCCSYILGSSEYQDLFIAIATSSGGQANLSPGQILGADIFLPPYDEQRAIAHILGTLDDKIELNRRMSETLEAMARALFKSWFVDFDPVRWKMERQGAKPQSRNEDKTSLASLRPGDFALPPALAALFPDSFEDSDLGEIPRGWEVAKLDDLAAIQGGKQLTTADCQPTGMFPVFGANGIMGYASRATHDGFVIAFGRVGAYCGSVHWTYAGAWINNNASSVVPKRWPEFVLQTMLEADFEGMRTGSAQPFIPNTSLAALQVIRAPDNVLDEFCAIVHSLRLKEQALHCQSRTLAALRDALLPKLISGELRVKDAERIIQRQDAMAQGRKGEKS